VKADLARFSHEAKKAKKIGRRFFIGLGILFPEKFLRVLS
jgi:hypothetical protein